MLTLITGTPGAGKSLYAVSEIASKVPGSSIENGQEKVPRRLLSNIKNLVIQHEHIDAQDLNTWHEWAQPGDVILFDEVQEVWRPRGLGTKVPECIAKLETHRHMGVDLILVTQHPMLVDPNIRRLVNQHIHMRRITKTVAMAYEWDHCENPGNTRTCISSKVWMHPKRAYKLYKSAQLHTKPTQKLPAIIWLGVLALGGLAYAGPMAFDRLKGSLGQGEKVAQGQSAPTQKTVDGMTIKTETTTHQGKPPELISAQEKDQQQTAPAVQQFAGCITVGIRCGCFGQAGEKINTDEKTCRENSAAAVSYSLK